MGPDWFGADPLLRDPRGGRIGGTDLSLRRVLLEAATHWAWEAGEVTLAHFGAVLDAESKSDGSPVTLADREAEALLRSRIRERFPGHGILGEEEGEEFGDEPIRWILDPIDGTRSFMRGVPLYAVLIGIEGGGVPLVGVAHFPALGETVAAAIGVGCLWYRRGLSEPIAARVSSHDRWSEAALLTTDPARIEGMAVAAGWRELSARAGLVRSWGDAYGHALVATGRAEAMVDPLLSPWDAAPLLPILSEAGGVFTDLSGMATVHGGSGISSNGCLHRELLERLGAHG